MGIGLATQLRQFLLFAGVGAALGLWYELLRPLRRGRVWTAGADLLFALGVLLTLFGVGQRAAEGAFYLYMAATAALGFALWLRFAAPPVRRRLRALGARLAALYAASGLEKMRRQAKNRAASLFSSAAKWVTIVWERTKQAHRARGRRQTAYETAQGKRTDTARHRSAARLRRRTHRADADKTGRRRKNAERAERAGGGA